MIPLEPLKEIAEKCVRCGICQSVCPVFAELKREASVARGKVTLIGKLLSQEADYSGELSTYVLQCLGCGACSENCPNGVRADELILAARALLVEKKGLPLPKRVILRGILRSVHLLPSLLKTGSLLQGLLLKRIPEESGLRLRFSLPCLDKDRFIPPIAAPFFLDRYPEEARAEGTSAKAALFAGCSIQYLFPLIGESTVRLLTRSGFSVAFPKDQGCCGLPAYGSGDTETAKALALRNVKAFSRSGLDRIIVPCGSCYYFLKGGYLKLFPGDDEVKAFSERIVDPSVFLLNQAEFHGPVSPADRPQRLRITYHDPCHMRRGMKIYQEPRKLLRSLPGIELVEMKQPDRCCGMAGSFNMIYYDLSRKILRHKLDDIEATRADAVVTNCMGCLIQLKDGIHQKKMKTKVLHLTEVLDKSSE